MKRLIISFALLSSVLGVCYFGVKFVESTYEKINSELTSSEKCMEAGDFEGARKAAEKAEKIYEKREQQMAAFVNHGILDEVGVRLSAVVDFANKESREEFFSHAAQAKTALTHLRNDHKFLMGNLF